MDLDVKNEFVGLKKSLVEIKTALSKTVTKDGLKNFATKDDLKFFKLHFEEEIADMKEHMLTKEYFMEHLSTIDGMFQEAKELGRSRLLFERQFVTLDDTVHNHGKRITALEKKAHA